MFATTSIPSRRSRRFELRLYAREQARNVRFDRPGIVPLGCNIHDSMIAFINVVDTELRGAHRRRGAGAFHRDCPAGQVLVRIWHPYLRAPGNQVEMRVAVPDHGTVSQAVPVNLRPPPRLGSAY